MTFKGFCCKGWALLGIEKAQILANRFRERSERSPLGPLKGQWVTYVKSTSPPAKPRMMVAQLYGKALSLLVFLYSFFCAMFLCFLFFSFVLSFSFPLPLHFVPFWSFLFLSFPLPLLSSSSSFPSSSFPSSHFLSPFLSPFLFPFRSSFLSPFLSSFPFPSSPSPLLLLSFSSPSPLPLLSFSSPSPLLLLSISSPPPLLLLSSSSPSPLLLLSFPSPSPLLLSACPRPQMGGWGVWRGWAKTLSRWNASQTQDNADSCSLFSSVGKGAAATWVPWKPPLWPQKKNESVRERLLRTNRMRIVAFHSPTEAMIIDENVYPLQRIWCLFEVYHTIQFSQSGDHFQGFIFKRRAEGQGRDGKNRYYILLLYNVAWVTPWLRRRILVSHCFACRPVTPHSV